MSDWASHFGDEFFQEINCRSTVNTYYVLYIHTYFISNTDVQNNTYGTMLGGRQGSTTAIAFELRGEGQRADWDGGRSDYASLCRLALIPGVTNFAGYRRWWREGRARRLAVGGACI